MASQTACLVYFTKQEILVVDIIDFVPEEKEKRKLKEHFQPKIACHMCLCDSVVCVIVNRLILYSQCGCLYQN